MDNRADPTFRGNALYGNGDYGGFPEQSPAIKTPSLNYSAFTVALRFKAISFKNKNNNILTGGRYSRWMSFCTGANFSNPSGNLTLTFNDQEFRHEYPIKLEVNKWHSLVCGVNLRSKTVTTYLDGDQLPRIKLPDNFKLAILEGDTGLVRKARERSWYLSNYSTHQVFHGLIDELAVFDGDVAANVAKDYQVDPLMLKVLLRDRFKKMSASLRDEIKNEYDQLPGEFDRIAERLDDAGIQASTNNVIQYVCGKTLDKELEQQIARLIRHLGDDSYLKREGATTQLRSLGLRAREALKAAQSTDDIEVGLRAKSLLDALSTKSSPPPTINFALDYLRIKPSPKAVTCLFTFINRNTSTKQFALACAALARCARPENREQIIKALASDNPRIRFAAIIASDGVLDSHAKKKFLETYLSDADELVRLAASSLLYDRSEAALPAMAKLRSSRSFTTRYLVEHLIDSEVIDLAP